MIKPERSYVGSVFLLILIASLLSGCGLLYTDVHVPRAYRSASPIDVDSKASDKMVTGRACNHSVIFLVAWGNGGYAEAVKNALAEEPPGSILYDVYTDFSARLYLVGLYTRSCTVVTGKVWSP
jgi:hypothetical protein